MTTVSTSRADDFDVVAARLLEAASQNPGQASVIRGYRDSLRSDGTWPDVDYQNRSPGGWKARPHLQRMVALAKAYRSDGHDLKGDAKLKAAILRAHDTWFSIVPKGPKNTFGTPESDNWWHNEFGAVTNLQDVHILMGDEIDATRRAAASPAMMRFWTGSSKTAGARDKGDNLFVRTYLGMRQATLARDAAFMNEVVARTVKELEFSGDEGVHRDFSFRTHNLLYSLHYGLGYVLHPTDTLLMVRGTRFAPPLEKMQLLSDFVLEGHAWQFRRGWMDYATTGRAISEVDYQSRRQKRALDAYKNLVAIDAPRKAEIEALIARIEKDNAIGEPSGNRHFWRGDMMVHKRPTYHASIRMASNRIKAVELINYQGILGFYTADGVMSLQRRGPEYSNLMPVWDWTRLPGITARAAKAPPALAPPERWGSGGHLQGVGEFVGGVSDGQSGAATFDYNRNGVKARKSWFFFDREIVALGAGISSESADAIRTSVNQAHLLGDVTSNGTKVARGERVLGDVSFVHHDQTGYVFPTQNAAVTLKNEAQTGNWKRVFNEASDKMVSTDVFSLWLDHGAKPQNAAYSYVIVPEISASQLADYAQKPPVRIIANTSQLQAVTREDDKITQAIFYEAGTLALPDGRALAVNQPCALMMREKGAQTVVSVSNPTQTALKVSVQIGFNRLAFDLPGGEEGGKTVTQSSESGLARGHKQLFLLIGQSNMAGRGAVEAQDTLADPRIWMLSKELEWQIARDPLHFDKPSMAGVGLGSQFAREIAKNDPDASIGLIPCAFGGTSLDEWKPGGKLYSEAVARTKEAMKSGTLQGILWHQGEADAGAAKTATYPARFAAMMAQLRQDLGAETVPIVVGELVHTRPGHLAFNAGLPKVVAEVPLSALVTAENLTHKGDQVHFDSKSLRTLGARYAAAFLKLQAKKKTES